MEDLIENTTGDGMVCGLGQVNGALFSEDRARTMIMSYDYMVLAGTQGQKNHMKKDRLFEVAEHYRLPTVLFAEGGGGRAGTGGARKDGQQAVDHRDNGMYRPMDTSTWTISPYVRDIPATRPTNGPSSPMYFLPTNWPAV